MQGEDFLCLSTEDSATNSRIRPTRYSLANSRLLPSRCNFAYALRNPTWKEKWLADSSIKGCPHFFFPSSRSRITQQAMAIRPSDIDLQ